MTVKKNTTNYNHKLSEIKWQKAWIEKDVFKFNKISNKEKYYVLEMFPYPSGRIHVGHLRNYAIGDAIARFKRMQGYNVLHPMGFDSFGLPAENAALEHKIHPKDWTLKNIEIMRGSLKSMGLSIDWSREIATCLPSYFKHEQKMFIDFVKNNLAYQKESEVNWDPVDKTVLANEQVIDGKGWRSGALVEKKKLKQWFLRVSQFSDELLSELKNLKGWDSRILSMQEKWIGKSEGLEIEFDIVDKSEKIKIYTTRADTIFGASFLAIAPDHPISIEVAKNNKDAQKFIDQCKKSSVDTQTMETQEKKGFKTNLKAKNPLSGDYIDIYIANFVLMDYGCGAIFGCPAHDERDFDFAKKYNLPITQVVETKEKAPLPFNQDGRLINSQMLDGLTSFEAKEKVFDILSKENRATKKTNYKLRDWGISRQRYWGAPIPILYLEDGRVVTVPDEQLPVELPEDPIFDGNGNPLANHKTWKYTNYIDKDGKELRAIRETDSFDTFFESSWYFLRFINPANDDIAFDKKLVNELMPVDQYIGGIEHAVLHLLYARFFTKALKKCGYLDFDEPFKNVLTQGMVCHQTFKDKNGKWLYPGDIDKKDGKFYNINSQEEVIAGRSEKMSKSKKNIIEPSHIIDAYGADTARLFVLSDSPPERDIEWLDSGVNGCWVYINRLWRLFSNFLLDLDVKNLSSDIEFNNIKDSKAQEIIKLTHKTIAKTQEDYNNKLFNVVIAKIREFSNALEKISVQNNEQSQAMFFALKSLSIIIAPIMPHLAEELWQKLGFKDLVVNQLYPKYDSNLIIDDEIGIALQVCGKLRAVIKAKKDTPKSDIEKMALANENVQKFINDKEIKKIIIVPNKLVNIVAI